MNLKEEHALITKQYYQDKSLTKEEFERLHIINALKQAKANGDFDGLSEQDIDDRISELET